MPLVRYFFDVSRIISNQFLHRTQRSGKRKASRKVTQGISKNKMETESMHALSPYESNHVEVSFEVVFSHVYDFTVQMVLLRGFPVTFA